MLQHFTFKKGVCIDGCAQDMHIELFSVYIHVACNVYNITVLFSNAVFSIMSYIIMLTY